MFAIFVAMFYFVPNSYFWYVLGGLILLLLLLFYKILPFSKCIENAYELLFFKWAKLDEIPQEPVLAINATDLSTGNQFTFFTG